MRIDAAITSALEQLQDVSESARLDAELLLCKTIDMPRSYIFAHPEDELDERTKRRFEILLQRRRRGEPMAYILGTQEFWSHELLVSPATLVPRPETELLVELALRAIPKKTQWQVLDLGTGSGAVAVAIAAERPLCDVVATDISEDAIAIAIQNVRHADLANVTCLTGDWTAPVAAKQFDIIVSNPPYVRADAAALTKLGYEPMSALVSGDDGLRDLRILAADCHALLVPNGWLMLEHGADQETAVAVMLEERGWHEIACHNDLSGKPRVTVACRDGK